MQTIDTIIMKENENLDEWQARKYQEFYDEEYEFLHRRLQSGQTNADELQGVLDDLYIFDGNDLSGRSVLMQLSITATISAYEAVIAELRRKEN